MDVVTDSTHELSLRGYSYGWRYFGFGFGFGFGFTLSNLEGMCSGHSSEGEGCERESKLTISTEQHVQNHARAPYIDLDAVATVRAIDHLGRHVICKV